MWELIQYENGKYESSLDNVTEELLWVKKQIQRELSGLQQNVEEGQVKNSFFERKDGKVEYHMNLVKEYLQSCAQKEDFQINWATVMAVQIALESNGYEVGVIDWLLKTNSWATSKTEKAISKFQKDNNLRVDGVPWKKTILKILEKLGGVPQWNDTKDDEQKEDEHKNEPEKKEWEKITEKELLALEIYRWKVVTDKEIERRWFDPEEIWTLVYNKELMEYYDDIVVKTNRKKEGKDTPSQQIPEKDDKAGEDAENVENEDSHREVSPNIKPKINKRSGEVENLEEILETRNLVLPKLKANDVSEIGWLWNSMMFGFQWYWKNNDKHFTQMMWAEWASTTTHIMKFKSEEHVMKYHKNNPHIKSFVLYFGWNTSNNEQTLSDLKNWAERLSKAWIEPVLCTCIGVDSHITKDQKYSDVGGRRLEPLNDSIRQLANESKWKYKLIDFAKVDDVIDKAWDKIHPKSYALMHDIVYKCIENKK